MAKRKSMTKRKKTIKEELKREISALYKGKKEISMYYFVISFIKEALQRFIEETRIEKDNVEVGNEFEQVYQDGYNQALKDIEQKQQQWLKENL